MAKIQMQGMSQYLDELRRLDQATGPLCKAVVYAGASLVADAVRTELETLDRVTDAEALAAWQDRRPVKISVTQKIGLIKSFGVTPISDKFGIYSAKLGFDGYNDVKSDRWPNGQPNQLIARACESGSTAMKKQPYMRRAVNRTKHAAEFVMEQTANKQLEELTGGNNNG